VTEGLTAFRAAKRDRHERLRADLIEQLAAELGVSEGEGHRGRRPLPAPRRPPPRQAVGAPTRRMLARDPRVLVVDDEASIRESLERALRLEGFAVETADGGTAALAAVAREPPAVIVLDVTMPDLDGVTVLKRLRARGVDVPVCVLSARDDVEDRSASCTCSTG
jgi:CheY-like chemotaxis protein